MLRKSTAFIFALVAFVVCTEQFAYAGKTSASIQPKFLQASIKSAGIQSEIVLSSDAVFSRNLYIPDLKGSTVTIGFPATGLVPGKSFSLEIDGMMALVTYTHDRKLEVAAGDSRIETAGAFGLVSCILTSVFDMVEGILKNTATLNIFGIISAVFTGVINIIGCV